jgi:serine/threonine protein phosphatase PrpC
MPDVIVEKNGVNKYDYILIGSDGIFDKLKNENINKTVWEITTFQRT